MFKGGKEMTRFLRNARGMAILTLALVMVFMVACGSDDDDTPVATATPTPAATTGNDAGGDAPADPIPVTGGRDLGGRNVVVNSWWAYMDAFLGEGATEPDPAVSGNYLLDRMIWDNLQWFQEEYNVTMSNIVVSWDDTMPTLTSSVMAGDPVADIQVLFGWMTLTALVGDLIMPASQFAAPDSDLLTLNRYLRPGSVFDGEIWNVVSAAPAIWQVVNLGVNLDIIAAAGAEDPRDLLARGEWNWDNFREIMMATTRDTTGDGMIDQFGISGPHTFILLSLLAANAGPTIDGDLNYALDHPASMRAIEFFHEIFTPATGWWYANPTGDPMDSWGRDRDIYLEGRSAFWPVEIWQIQGATGEGGEGIPFDFTFMPWPAGPDNDRGYTHFSGFAQGVTVPVGVHNPQDAWFVYEQFRSWSREDYWLVVEAERDAARSYLLREDCVNRFIDVVAANPMVDLARTIPEFDGVTGDLATAFWNGEMTPAQAVEAFRFERQAQIDAFFN
jgi:multiple sugar transport system substrate-binding protein